MKNKKIKQGKNTGFWIAYALECIAAWHLGAQAAEKVFPVPEKPTGLEKKVQSVQPAEVNNVEYAIEPNNLAEQNHINKDVSNINKPYTTNNNKPNYINLDLLNPSKNCIELIKQVEEFSPVVYDDRGKPAIGYGHQLKKSENFGKISEKEAEKILLQDLDTAKKAVSEYVKVPLSQGKYDALCSFVYNIGTKRFSESTLLKKLNQGDYEGAMKEFKRWVHTYENGKKQALQGLKNRRQQEEHLFCLFKTYCS